MIFHPYQYLCISLSSFALEISFLVSFLLFHSAYSILFPLCLSSRFSSRHKFKQGKFISQAVKRVLQSMLLKIQEDLEICLSLSSSQENHSLSHCLVNRGMAGRDKRSQFDKSLCEVSTAHI